MTICTYISGKKLVDKRRDPRAKFLVRIDKRPLLTAKDEHRSCTHRSVIDAVLEIEQYRVDVGVAPVLLVKAPVEKDRSLLGTVVVERADNGQRQRAARCIERYAIADADVPACREIARDQHSFAACGRRARRCRIADVEHDRARYRKYASMSCARIVTSCPP